MSFLSAEISKFMSMPVELYELSNGVKKWYFTSSDQDVRFNDIVWLSQTIKRGEVIMSNDLKRSDLKINFAENTPLKQYFLNDGLKYDLDLTIYRLQIKEDKAIPFFDGTLGDWTIQNELEISCTFQQIGQFLLSNSQRYKYGYNCQHDQYTRKCSLSKDQHSREDLTVVDVTGNYITVEIPNSMPIANNYFTGLAWFYGEDDAVERYIISDTIDGINRVIKIDFTFDNLQVGDKLNLATGCKNTSAGCKAQNNFDNYLGFEYVPDIDMFLTGIQDR